MLRKLRERMAQERGFTLIELLVVVLIIGILAAIAIPAFLGQREKAQDGEAKSAVQAAASAADAYRKDKGSYTGMDKAKLQSIEPSLKDGQGDTLVATPAVDGKSYDLVVTSKSSVKYTYEKNADGTTTRTCDQERAACTGAGATW